MDAGTPPPDTAPPDTKRTTYLELFFDLVFVFAITQLAGMLHADHSAQGWGRAGIMAWLVWWAWSQYTWVANAVDVDRRWTRLVILGATAVTLLAAVTLPDAFGPQGLWFALAYAAVRLVSLALYWFGSDPEFRRGALRTYVPVALVSPALIVAGGFAPEAARPWIWLAAALVDVASALAAGRGEFRVAVGHFAERHALIVIIALGESVVAEGATVAGLELTPALLATALAAFAVVASLWWGYFDWVQEAAEERLRSAPTAREQGRLARDLFTFAHFPIVAGTVLVAVGVEEALLHPTAPLDGFGRLALGAGLALFLVGFLAGNARATRGLLIERAVGTVAVLALVGAAGGALSALVLLALVAAVLVAVAGAELARNPTTEPGSASDQGAHPRPASA